MKKKMLVGAGVGVMLGIVAFGSVYVGAVLPQNKLGSVTLAEEEISYNQGKINFIDQTLGKHYIDEVDSEDLVEGIYRGYVYGLDDTYTRYLPKDEYTKQKEASVGNYVGMGIQFAWGITNQHIIVTEVVEGSPADQAGIQVGDKIIEIDGTLAMASNETLIYEKLMYSGDEPVVYTVVDNDETNERKIELQADIVEIDLVTEELLADGTGYVVLDGLVETSTDEIEDVLESLKAQGATRFIIDIRDAYSDNIEAARELCDVFLEAQAVFQVEDGKGEPVVYETTEGSIQEPIIILTSVYTEGTLEAFAGAMQESGRALLVGEKTTGNGTVQEKIALEDGSGLIVTTGLVTTAQGKAIKDEGITPDIIQKKPMAETLELVTKGQISHENDAVLQKALESFQK